MCRDFLGDLGTGTRRFVGSPSGTEVESVEPVPEMVSDAVEPETTKSRTVGVSILLPAYNEQNVIAENVEAVRANLEGVCETYELIVIDDGSSDDTGDEVRSLLTDGGDISLISYDTNRGKGFALRKGIQHASGDVVGFIDADLDVDPGELRRFIEKLQRNEADLVIGSKHRPESDVVFPFYRRVLSNAYATLVGALFDLSISDSQTGIKFFRYEVAEKLFEDLQIDGYAFDVEILVRARERGYEIQELPVTIDNECVSNINAFDVARIFRDTVGLFLDRKLG